MGILRLIHHGCYFALSSFLMARVARRWSGVSRPRQGRREHYSNPIRRSATRHGPLKKDRHRAPREGVRAPGNDSARSRAS